MMKFLTLAGLAGIMLCIVTGCAGSPATRYYVLTPMADEGAAKAKAGKDCPAIGIGPVEMPQYLARPQIAISSSHNEITYADFDQWAQPLAANVSHVVAQNLIAMMCTGAVYQFPWTGQQAPDYRVRIDITRMAGAPGGEAVVEAWWTVSDVKEKKVIASQRSRYSEAVKGDDYRALVQAYSRAFGSLSSDIAKALPGR